MHLFLLVVLTQYQPGGLTADQAAAAAVRTSRDVQARRAVEEGASAGVDAAKFGFIPRLNGNAGYTRVSDIDPPILGLGDEGRFLVTKGPAGPLGERAVFAAPDIAFPVYLDNYRLAATLTIPISDYLLRTARQVAVANKTLDAAAWDTEAAQRKAAADAKVAYYQWVRGRGALAVAEQSLEQNKGRLSDAQNAFTAGSASRADLLRAESAVESARLFQARARNSAALSETQLMVAMHDPKGGWQIGEDVNVPPPGDDVHDGSALISEATDQRVELKSIESSKAALSSQRSLVQAAYFPRLDATGGVLYADPNQRYIPNDGQWHFTWDVGVVLSWTPSDIPVTAAQAAQVSARVSQTEAQREGLVDALTIEVRQAQLAVEESAVALESTVKGLSSAEEAYRVRQELYRAGRAILVELLDSETELTRARLEALNARIDARIAHVRLEHATGRDHLSPRATRLPSRE